MAEEIERNPLRDAIVKGIITQHHGEPITVEHLAQYLPDTFDLGEDDIAQYQQPAEVAPVKVGHVWMDPGAAARHAAAKSVTPAPVTDPAAIEAATQRRIKADQDLANRRVELLAAQSAERDCRTTLSVCVVAFQKGFAPVSPEALRRSHVAEQAEIRAAIQDGRLNPRKNPGHGKSYFDRMRSERYHDVNDAARRHAPLTHEQAQRLYPGSTGPGTKGNLRGASRIQIGAAKIHGER